MLVEEEEEAEKDSSISMKPRENRTVTGKHANAHYDPLSGYKSALDVKWVCIPTPLSLTKHTYLYYVPCTMTLSI